ncbi:MAG TPA: hypothetical protein VEA99_05285 [Gemmatimonadaceae bacterium]|nr:hypothetical protein [Gemmatimonadaceae bacterium]
MRASTTMRRTAWILPLLVATPLAAQVRLAGRDLDMVVQRGRQLVLQHGCGDCHARVTDPRHAEWMAGTTDTTGNRIGPFILLPRNLTPDRETGAGRWTDRQLFNAVRYGLKPGANPDVEVTSPVPGQGNHPASPRYLSVGMPWMSFRHMPDEDLQAIIAYLRHGVKPVRKAIPENPAPPDFWASEYTEAKIGPFPVAAYPTVNETGAGDAEVVRGRDLVVMHACGECHGGSGNPASPHWLQGSKSEQPPGTFAIGPFKTRPRNLTPDNVTGLGRFSERQLFNALRHGLRPGETPDVEITSRTPGQGNYPLHPKYLAPPMPWPAFRHMPDDELRAVAAYLKRGLKPVRNRVADSEGPPDFWASEYAKYHDRYPAAPFPAGGERKP